MLLGEQVLIPNIAQWLYLQRKDLQATYSLDNQAEEYIHWFLNQTANAEQYPYSQQCKAGLIEFLKAPAIIDGKPSKLINHYLLLIRNANKDLQKAYDTTTEEGAMQMALWWHKHGESAFDHNPDFQLSPSPVEELYFEDSDTSVMLLGEQVLLPHIAEWTYTSRPDINDAFNIENRPEEYIAWFLKQEGVIYPSNLRAALNSNLITFLKNSATVTNKKNQPLVNLLLVIHQLRPDIQQAFDLGSAESINSFIEWWHDKGKAEFGLNPLLMDMTGFDNTNNGQDYLVKQTEND